MRKYKKTFIVLQFGKPHMWTQEFIDHVQHLKQYGFYFLIITPNKFRSKGNVKIVKMDILKFNKLVHKKTGVNPLLSITKSGVPSYHVTDFMVGFGLIFEDYLLDTDFWGLIGIDCVLGRLDSFIPDFLLRRADVFSDDQDTFNGNFSLLRNNKKINNLFKLIPNWQFAFSQMPCPKCVTGTGLHDLRGTDEYGLTEVLRCNRQIRFFYPMYFIHGHDRLEIHIPEIQLSRLKDGSLFQKITDVGQPEWEHGHQNFAQEIAYFHFSQTKKWPTINK